MEPSWTQSKIGAATRRLGPGWELFVGPRVGEGGHHALIDLFFSPVGLFEEGANSTSPRQPLSRARALPKLFVCETFIVGLRCPRDYETFIVGNCRRCNQSVALRLGDWVILPSTVSRFADGFYETDSLGIPRGRDGRGACGGSRGR